MVLYSEGSRSRLRVMFMDMVTDMFMEDDGNESETVEDLAVDSSLHDTLRTEGVHVSFFKESYSGRIVVVGGRGILQFYEIHERVDGSLSLSLIANAAAAWNINEQEMVSCLCMPPIWRNGAITDWIVVGAADGTMYGISFTTKNKYIEVNWKGSGRFRTNTHSISVPIRALLPVYGAEPQAHHAQIEAEGTIYEHFLNEVEIDRASFFSLGANGKLLRWMHHGMVGWEASGECTVTPQCRQTTTVAGHLSRVVPNIIVIVDYKHKTFMCFDLSKVDCSSPFWSCSFDKLPAGGMSFC